MKLAVTICIIFFVGLMALTVVSSPGKADGEFASVSIVCPSSVNKGDTFTVNITIEDVADLAGCNYDITYNSSIISAITNGTGGPIVVPGSIGGEDLDVSRFGFIPEGTQSRIRVIQDFYEDGATLSGSGFLVSLNFTAIAAGSTAIGLENRVLSNSRAEKMTADWFDGTIQVIAPNTPPSGGGGGGGGGGGATDDKRFTNLSGSMSAEGDLWEEVIAQSVDIQLELVMPKGTRVLNANGFPPFTLTVTTLGEPGDPPADSSFIGSVYDITPNGLTFYPHAILNLYYDEGSLPEGTNEQGLRIYTWNAVTLAWELMDCTVDTVNNVISARITHLCQFAVVAGTRPAAFKLGDLTIGSSEISVGEFMKAAVTVTNSGDLAGTFNVDFLVDGVQRAGKSVTLNGHESREVSVTFALGAPGQYVLQVGDLKRTFTVKAAGDIVTTTTTTSSPLGPAVFTLSSLTIGPDRPVTGDQVTASLLAANTGESDGSFRAVFLVNGSEVETRTVELQAGKSREVRFTFTPERAGAYSVSINGMNGSFSVVEPPLVTTTTSPAPPRDVPTVSWLWLGVGIGSILLIGVLIVLLMWRLGRRVKE